MILIVMKIIVCLISLFILESLLNVGFLFLFKLIIIHYITRIYFLFFGSFEKINYFNGSKGNSKSQNKTLKICLKGAIKMKELTIKEAKDMMKNCLDSSLVMSETDFTELPDNLIVKGDLVLDSSCITKLPKNLVVGGNAEFWNTKIKSIPDDAKLNGDIILEDSSIESLPDNLTVYGNLNLNNTLIESLPKGLTVLGDLSLLNSHIKELPDDLVVYGTTYLKNSYIKSLSVNTKLNGKVKTENDNYNVIKNKVYLLITKVNDTIIGTMANLQKVAIATVSLQDDNVNVILNADAPMDCFFVDEMKKLYDGYHIHYYINNQQIDIKSEPFAFCINNGTSFNEYNEIDTLHLTKAPIFIGNAIEDISMRYFLNLLVSYGVSKDKINSLSREIYNFIDIEEIYQEILENSEVRELSSGRYLLLED